MQAQVQSLQNTSASLNRNGEKWQCLGAFSVTVQLKMISSAHSANAVHQNGRSQAFSMLSHGRVIMTVICLKKRATAKWPP